MWGLVNQEKIECKKAIKNKQMYATLLVHKSVRGFITTNLNAVNVIACIPLLTQQ